MDGREQVEREEQAGQAEDPPAFGVEGSQGSALRYFHVDEKAAQRLEQRAIRRGWLVPAEKRRAIIDRQVDIAVNGDARYAVPAAQAVIMAHNSDRRAAIEMLKLNAEQPAQVTNITQVNIGIDFDAMAAAEAELFGVKKPHQTDQDRRLPTG